jgi:hypothetical protein
MKFLRKRDAVHLPKERDCLAQKYANGQPRYDNERKHEKLLKIKSW